MNQTHNANVIGGEQLPGPPPPETPVPPGGEPRDGVASSRQGTRKGVLVALLAALLVFVGTGAYWFVTGRAAPASSEKMDEALAGLNASISSAEESLAKAKDATEVLTLEAEAADDPGALQTAEEAADAIVEVEETLVSAREVAKTAESLGRVTDHDIENVEEAAIALDSLVEELDEVTDFVEETTEELAGQQPEMSLGQIARGDYSSIRGRWEDSLGNHALVDDTTIEFYADGALYAMLDGVTYKNMSSDGEGGVGKAYENIGTFEEPGRLLWEMNYAPDGVPVAHGANGLIGFFEVGAPFDVEPYIENLPSDESAPRLLWWAYHGFGRGYIDDDSLTDSLLYWVGPLDDVDRSEPEDEADTTASGCAAPVPGAYPCAGGPVPAEAKPLPDRVGGYGDKFAAGQSPSGNITCEIPGTESYILCSSLGNKRPAGETEGYPVASMDGSGPFIMGSKHDPMLSKNFGPFEGDVLPYGTVWYYDDFVISSEESGFTVWNAASGYGALFNNSGFYPFGP